MAVAAVVGLDADNSVGYQGFALLFCLLAVAVAWSWFFRLKFSARRVLPRFGTVGEKLNYRVVLGNPTPKTQGGLEVLDNLADARPTLAEWRAMQMEDERLIRSFQFSRRRRSNPFKLATIKAAPAPALAGNQETEVPLEVMPMRRGPLRFTGITLARSDPFGLFRAFSKVPAPQSIMILPKRYPVSAVGLPGTLKFQDGGVALASRVGQSEEFVSLRDYRRGDPMRHIHWRSWARTGRPIVKEFEDEFFVRHALVLDTFTERLNSEEFEEAVSVAASFVSSLRTQESLLDLLFVGAQAFCFTSGRGLAHSDQMLEILASVRECPDKPFTTLEELVLGHLGAVSGCICVLLAWDKPRQEFVRKIKSTGVPVRVFVVTGFGAGAMLEPGPLRDEPENFRVLEVGRIEQGLAKS